MESTGEMFKALDIFNVEFLDLTYDKLTMPKVQTTIRKDGYV